MDYYDVKRLALVLAVQAEIEGMKFDNLLKEQESWPHDYSDQDFKDKAGELENLAHTPNDRI